MLQIDRRIITHFDFLIPLLVAPIALSSLFLISEVNESLAAKEFMYIVVGFLLFAAFSIIPIRKISWLIPIIYWIDISFLVSVKFFGVSVLGAQRWLQIPFTSMTIQPSEIIKPALLLMLAYLIQKNPPPSDGYDLKSFAKISFYILLPFFLIAIEPDLGSASVVLMLGFGALFLTGVRWKIWVAIIALFLTTSTLIYEFGQGLSKTENRGFSSRKAKLPCPAIHHCDRLRRDVWQRQRGRHPSTAKISTNSHNGFCLRIPCREIWIFWRICTHFCVCATYATHFRVA